MPTLTLCGYERISHDPTGQQAGVDRQHHDILHLAAIFGAEVCWHRDNDLSAFDEDVTRPAFELMLEHVGDPAHPSRGMLAFDLDRLFRRGDDLQRALKLYKRDETLVFRTSAQEINLSTPDGRLMAEIMVAFAQKESADKQRRVRRMHYFRALAGKPTGPAGFGHLPDRCGLHPVEAPLVAAAAEDLLTGRRTAYRIARAWNKAGHLPRPRRKKLPDGTFTEPFSRPWSGRTVSQLLRQPRVGGFVVYQDELMYDGEGRPLRSAVQQPIVDPDRWLELRALLLSPERGAGVNTRADGYAYLGSGKLRCGGPEGCDHRLIGHTDRRTEVHRYLCPGGDGRGCGRNSIDGAGVDAVLNAYVEGALSEVQPEELGYAVEPWGREDELAEASARHADALAAYVTGSSPLSRQTQVQMLEGLEERVEALRREQRAHLGREAQARALADAGDLARWQAAYAEQDWEYCRVVVDALVLRVTVRKAQERGRRGKAGAPRWFDPARVEIVPRTRS